MTELQPPLTQETPSFKELLKARAELLARAVGQQESVNLQPFEIQSLLHDLQVHQIELEMQNEELRSTQSVLATSRDKYSYLYDFAPVGYCSLNKGGIILECNHTLSRMLGRGRDKLLRHHISSLVEREDIAIITHLLRRQEPQNDDLDYQLRLKGPEDKTLHTQLRLQPLPSTTLDEPAWMLALSDISRLQETSMALKIRSQALESTLEGVVITNNKSEICYVNPAFEETTGYSRDQVLGKTPQMLQSGKHNQTFYREMWSALSHHGKWRGEIWNRRASGEIYPEWLSISTIFDDWHRPLYY